MAYATASDVADYTGIEETELPDDIDRLIDRASEVIDEIIYHNFEEDNSDHIEATKKAVCAQIEYWFEISEDVDVTKMPSEFSIGSFSMGSATTNASMPKLAPRARRHLFLAGLLYSGRYAK